MRLLATTSLVAFALACAQTISRLGPSPDAATAHADTLLAALGARFGPHVLGARLTEIRPRLVQGSLVPSRIFNDSTMWTEADGSVRELELGGDRTTGGYRIGVAQDAPLPAHAAEYHRRVLLKQLEHGQYEWRVHDVLAIGDVQVQQLANALTALFMAAQRESGASARADYRASLPRATRALGRLVTLDTLAVAPSRRGATALALGVTVHPERLEQDAPHYARFLSKFVSPAHLRLTVYDDQGPWWTMTGDEGRFTARLRVRDGSLAPLGGPPRPMPARLHVRADLDTKMFVFRIGFRELVGDVVLTRTEHQKGFVVVFQHEPEWVLPPLVGRMIRTSLSRPFTGTGALLSFDLRDGDGAQTLALRDYRVAIEESAIMRWLGGLGNSALSDFHDGAEREADRFVGQAFAALEQDVKALALAARAGAGGP
jgi:hypothetical protein